MPSLYINNKETPNGQVNGPPSTKRSNYLEWQEYFMSIAFLSAQRSKDPRTQVGACIVNKEKKIVGIGYNGMPMGCSDDVMPWNRAADESKEEWLRSKSPYVCHAELNAVLNKNQADVSGCSIYVALFPCNMCAQIIIQSGIEEVIYYSDKYHDKPEFVASRFLMDTSGVKYRQFRPRQKQILIDFELIESTAGTVPTLPTVPITNGSSNGVSESLETDLRQRITTKLSGEKMDKNNCFTEKSFAVDRLKKDENSDIHNNNNLEQHADDINLHEFSVSERPSELSIEDHRDEMESCFSMVSLLFISSLILLTWYVWVSLEEDLLVPNISPSGTSVSWTQVSDNPSI